MVSTSNITSLTGPNAQKAHITKPESGTTINIVCTPGMTLLFDFEQGAANYERSENNLLLKLDDGGTIVLTDFFAIGEGELPKFELADGATITATDFLKAYDPDFDLSTAAGPTTVQSATPSSGLGDYENSSEALVDGIKGLKIISTDLQWSNSTGSSIEPLILINPEKALGSDNFDATPTTIPKHAIYNARAVLFTDTDATEQNDSIDVGLLFRTDPTYAFPVTTPTIPDAVVQIAGSDNANNLIEYQFSPTANNGNGGMIFTVTDAGRAWLQANPGENLFAYYEISIPGGQSYVLQVIIDRTRSFDSETQNNDGYLDPANGGEILFGEWYKGISGDTTNGYNVVTSKENDTLTFSETFQNNSQLWASGADGKQAHSDFNTINLNQGMLANNASNSIDSSDGIITINNGNNSAAIKATNGTNIVTSRAGTIKINAENTMEANGVFASEDGKNSISSAGTVEINSNGTLIGTGIKSDAHGQNEISASDITINADGKYAYGIDANSGGQNSMTATNDITIKANSELGDPDSIQKGMAVAVNASNGENHLYAKNVSLEAKGDISAGLFAEGSTGKNTVTASEKITIDVIGKNFAEAMIARDAGTNSMTAGSNGTIDISATAASATGMYATGDYSENKILDTKVVKINANGTDKANGIDVTDGAKNSIIDAETVEITSYATNTATGMAASNNGLNHLKTSSTTINADGKYAYGIDANSGGQNSMTATNDITIKANSELGDPDSIQKGMAVAVNASNGENHLYAKNVSLEAKGDISAGLFAEGSTGKNTVTASEKITIDVIGKNSAEAMIARDAGTNSMTAGSNGTIDISATAASATGMYATGDYSENKILDTKVVKINANGTDKANGIDVTDGAKNSIIDAETVEITSYATNTATGMTASNNGLNHLKTSSTTINADGKYAYGIDANSGGQNSMTATNDITIKANSELGDPDSIQKGMAVAVNASNGENHLYAKNVSLEAKGDISAGLFAEGSTGKNTVTASEKITIDVIGKNSAEAMIARDAGTNSMTAGSNGTIDISATAASATGMYATGDYSENKILDTKVVKINANGTDKANGIDVTDGAKNSIIDAETVEITSYATNTATGMAASNNGLNHLKTSSTTINADGKYAYGIDANSGGQNSMTATNDITIKANSELGDPDSIQKGMAVAVNASNGENHLYAKNVSLEAKGDISAGLFAEGSAGKNTVTASEKITIDVIGKNSAEAMIARDAGTNSMTAGSNGTIDISATAASATGMYATGDYSENKILDTKVVKINANGTDKANGIDVTDGAKNSIIDAETVEITSYATNTATGMAASNNGLNHLKTSSTTINADGKYAYGIDANSGGQNSMTATNDITIKANSELGDPDSIQKGMAVAVNASNGENHLYAKNVSLEAKGDISAGLFAEGSTGKNTVTASEKITIDVIGKNSAEAMVARDGGTNSITGNSVDMNIAGTVSYGMYAESSDSENSITADSVNIDISGAAESNASIVMQALTGGHNTISTSEINISMNTTGSSGGVIMNAKDSDSYNIIKAISDYQGVTVILKVNNSSGDDYAMKASGNGKNEINGSSKADFIHIKGDILDCTDNDNNVIKTGDGNDRIVLDGRIYSNNSLNIDAGAGYDILVLQAATWDEFATRYEALLLYEPRGNNIEELQYMVGDNSSPPLWFTVWAFATGIPIVKAEFIDNISDIDTTAANYLTIDDIGQNSAITFGAKSDYMYVTGDINDGTIIQLHHGNNALTVDGDVHNSDIGTGINDDIFIFHGDVLNSTINLYDGSDSLSINAGSFAGSIFKGGQGVDTLNISGLGHDIHLTQIIGTSDTKFEGFEVLDMRGNGSNKLTITLNDVIGMEDSMDSLLKLSDITRNGGSKTSLEEYLDSQAGDQAKILRIMGDDNDSIQLDSGWQNTGESSVTIGNITYDIYHNDNSVDSDKYLLVQHGVDILNNFGG